MQLPSWHQLMTPNAAFSVSICEASLSDAVRWQILKNEYLAFVYCSSTASCRFWYNEVLLNRFPSCVCEFCSPCFHSMNVQTANLITDTDCKHVTFKMNLPAITGKRKQFQCDLYAPVLIQRRKLTHQQEANSDKPTAKSKLRWNVVRADENTNEVSEGTVIMTMGRVTCGGGKTSAILHLALSISWSHTQKCRANAFSLWRICLIMALQK